MRWIARKVGLVVVCVVAASVTGYAVAEAAAPHAAPNPRPAHTAASNLAPPAKADLLFVPVMTCRLVDTSKHAGPILAGKTRSFVVSGSGGFVAQGGNSTGCGIPANVASISARITASTPAANGSFATYPTGVPTTAATLYFRNGQSVATDVTQAVAPGGGKALTVKARTGSANVVVDVTGYYEQQIDAYVNADGTLFSATNRVLAASNISTGVYAVTTDTDVYYCDVSATAASGSASTAVAYTGLNGIVSVVTYQGGTLTNLAFNITVTC